MISVNDWARSAKRPCLTAGLLGAIGCICGWIFAPRDFFISYLFAELFFLGLSLGSLCLLMIHHLTAGYWGYGLRRFFESAVGNLPLLALLFVPIFFGLTTIYPWEQPALVAASEVLQKKAPYLNTLGFVVRAAIVFTIWVALGQRLLKLSAEQDVTVSVEPTKKLRRLSGPGLVIYPISMTFAAVDWIMSLETNWYSTMFPVLICIGQVLNALTFTILLLSAAARSRQLEPLASEETFHKLGNLLLAFTMMWAYLAFSQLLIIWSGNLPHEISWYLHRISDGWRWVAVFIFLFHFLVPFFLLLSRPVKKRRRVLAWVAGCIFFAHIVAIWWTVAPSLFQSHFYISWLTFLSSQWEASGRLHFSGVSSENESFR
jgi:hypothetical protein